MSHSRDVSMDGLTPSPSTKTRGHVPSSPGRSPHHVHAALNSPALPAVFGSSTHPEVEEWLRSAPPSAHDMLEGKELVDISSDAAVETACTLMSEQDVTCLAVYELRPSGKKNYVGLFDYADLNAFLLLAVQGSLYKSRCDEDRVKQIIAKGKEGGDVSVSLACDLSGKNPLITLSPDSNLIAMLTAFSRGTHRILVVDEEADAVRGLIEDRTLVRWFAENVPPESPVFSTLSSPLFDLPYIANARPVVSLPSDATILDGMELMNNESVSSIAVVDVVTGSLLSAVSVTDIGKIVAPSQDKKIINAPLAHLVALIKEPYGSTDGEERYPVYGVLASNTLSYTMQKLLATNAHRVFITEDPFMASPTGGAIGLSGNLRGVVSMIDVLSVFARLANIPDVDPARHRRTASSTSSSSATSSSRSRTNSALFMPIPIPSSPRRGPAHSRRGSLALGGNASEGTGISLSPMTGSGLGLSGDKKLARSGSISRGEAIKR